MTIAGVVAPVTGGEALVAGGDSPVAVLVDDGPLLLLLLLAAALLLALLFSALCFSFYAGGRDVSVSLGLRG